MKKILLAGAALFFAVFLTGCDNMSRADKGMLIGGGVGGVAGAALTRGSVVGTVVGAGAGALVGRHVGKHHYHRHNYYR